VDRRENVPGSVSAEGDSIVHTSDVTSDTKMILEPCKIGGGGREGEREGEGKEGGEEGREGRKEGEREGKGRTDIRTEGGDSPKNMIRVEIVHSANEGRDVVDVA